MPNANCTDCGAALEAGVSFCTTCGAGVPHDTAAAAGEGKPASAGNRRARIIILCALLASLSGGLAVYLVAGDSDAPRVVLEPVAVATSDPFVANLDADPRAARRAASQARHPAKRFDVIDDPRSRRNESALAGRVARGTAPGLYGGTRDTRTCKVDQLVSFLSDRANADKAAAFARVLGIARGRIPEYLRTLTGVRLSFDTRVTNHGFADGRATPSQSLLQAGTAVLVDRSGVPRVKCNCGNPLLEPAELEDDAEGDETLDVARVAENADEAWKGLDPRSAVTVRPASQRSDDITLVDLETPDGLLERPVGSDGASARDTGTGDVKATLEWDSDADLDLHIIEPDTTEISYENKGPTSTGGHLDVDANIGCNENGSLENVFWPLGEAPDGDYVVKVHGFTVDDCGAAGDFKLTIKVAGQDPQIYEGSVSEDEDETYHFSSGR